MSCFFNRVLIRFLSVTALSAAAFLSHAQQLSELSLSQTVADAIAQFETSSRKAWAYKVTHYESEEGEITSSIRSHDPSLPEANRWRIIELNGKPPSASQEEAFLNNLKRESDTAKEYGFSFKLSRLIKLDSVQLHNQTADKLIATFDVNMPALGEDASKHLQGTLEYDKRNHFIRKIDVVNTNSFSPLLAATINQFNLSMRFIKLNQTIAPHEMNMMMKGTFAFFSEIDEVSTTTFSDYRYKGD